eukprot:3036080-Heterocapsa_arctica.AAC.1
MGITSLRRQPVPRPPHGAGQGQAPPCSLAEASGATRGARYRPTGGPHALRQMLRATSGWRLLGPGNGHGTIPAPPAL